MSGHFLHFNPSSILEIAMPLMVPHQRPHYSKLTLGEQLCIFNISCLDSEYISNAKCCVKGILIKEEPIKAE